MEALRELPQGDKEILLQKVLKHETNAGGV